MCGIIGYAGKENAQNIIINSLEKLEYRGYDSSGIALFLDKEVYIHKKKGDLSQLKSSMDSIDSTLGIGHTRWATHGVPNDINSHPHSSLDESVTLVHNGIIENFEYLKKKYIKNTLKSETDTEVIAELFSVFYHLEPLERITKVCSLIKGSYAFAIIFKDDKDKIYCAKNKSPLIVAENKSGSFACSDVNAIGSYIKDFYVLGDNEIAVLSKEEQISFYNFNLSIIKKSKKSFSAIVYENIKGYKSLMEKEIFEIPDAAYNTCLELISKDEKISNISKDFFSGVNKIYLIGCGTAYHACMAGKLLLEKNTGIVSLAENASEFRYSSPVLDDKTLTIFISQSGETADTLACLKLAKSKKCRTLSITNSPNSSITFMSQKYIITKAGIERAVASTKAYVCQIISLFALTHFLSEKTEEQYNKKTKTLAKKYKKIGKELLDIDYSKYIDLFTTYKKIFYIGRNLDYITAREASLKLKEITYISSIDIGAGELKHGTLALVDSDSLVIVFITQKYLLKKTMNAVHEITSRGGSCLILTPFDMEENKNIKIFKLPKNCENISPVVFIVPMQLIACKVCYSLGLNPDKPRNLAKSVTVE